MTIKNIVVVLLIAILCLAIGYYLLPKLLKGDKPVTVTQKPETNIVYVTPVGQVVDKPTGTVVYHETETITATTTVKQPEGVKVDVKDPVVDMVIVDGNGNVKAKIVTSNDGVSRKETQGDNGDKMVEVSTVVRGEILVIPPKADKIAIAYSFDKNGSGGGISYRAAKVNLPIVGEFQADVNVTNQPAVGVGISKQVSGNVGIGIQESYDLDKGELSTGAYVRVDILRF